MNKKKYIYIVASLSVMLMTSACGAESNSGSNSQPSSASPDVHNTQPPEILIIIDQTPKPIEGNSFDFAVNKLPEGYSLTEIQWISEKREIINTIKEAIEHGQNGEDGFYISGNGQFSGFIYPDEMKGEEGQIIFKFNNDEGKELSWKKELILN